MALYYHGITAADLLEKLESLKKGGADLGAIELGFSLGDDSYYISGLYHQNCGDTNELEFYFNKY